MVPLILGNPRIGTTRLSRCSGIPDCLCKWQEISEPPTPRMQTPVVTSRFAASTAIVYLEVCWYFRCSYVRSCDSHATALALHGGRTALLLGRSKHFRPQRKSQRQYRRLYRILIKTRTIRHLQTSGLQEKARYAQRQKVQAPRRSQIKAQQTDMLYPDHRYC